MVPLFLSIFSWIQYRELRNSMEWGWFLGVAAIPRSDLNHSLYLEAYTHMLIEAAVMGIISLMAVLSQFSQKHKSWLQHRQSNSSHKLN